MISQCNTAKKSSGAKTNLKNDLQKKNILCTRRCKSSGTKNKYDQNLNQKYPPPTRGSIFQTQVMSLKDYEYFRNQALDKTSDELEAELEKAEMEKKRLIEKSSKRKEMLRVIDMKKSQQKDTGQNEILAENEKKRAYILDRAELLQLEQEEEIKKCNKIILGIKCRIIRDAQIAEKKVLKKQLETEERRLNDMMENQRRWQIQEEEEKNQEKIVKQQYFIQTLKNQIAENEEMRLLEYERKQEESRAINLSFIDWQESELAKMQEKHIENLKVQKQLAEVNEQLKHFKEMEKEEEKIIDMRIKKFQRLKEERELKLQEEKKKLEMKKSMEKERLAEQAVHSKQFQEQIEEINAARIQEEVEREWRRKEKEEALKRLEKKKTLMQGREEQLKNKRLLQAIEIERDKREYKRVLDAQKVALVREQEKLKKKQREAEKHKHEILKQVNEKERERTNARKQLFEEGIAIQTKAELRKNKLNAAIERKCEDMKKAHIPDVYIDEMKRIINKI